MNHREIYELRRNMSYVRKVFVTSAGTVGVVYVGPYTKEGRLKVMLQLYSAKGTFLKETELMQAKAANLYEVYFYFKKAGNRFYVLDTDTDDTFNQHYRVHEFGLKE